MLAFASGRHLTAERPARTSAAPQCPPTLKEGAETETPALACDLRRKRNLAAPPPAGGQAVSKAAISTAAALRATLAAGAVGAT